MGLGLNHMVRIIEFDDDVRWVARLRMPPLAASDSSEDWQHLMETTASCEYNTMKLVRQKTSIPIPKVHAFEPRMHCDVKAPFMLMDCLPGNAGMDLGMQIPPRYKEAFFRHLACIYVRLATIQLPKIGTILSQNEDGTFEQGPIPGLGGPFNTASEYFEAWAAKAEFGLSDEELRMASGEYADEIMTSVSSFPSSIRELAGKISAHDQGPFPICHGDFGHNNTVVDDEYRVLGLIDWEFAFAAPWEVFADFPLTLSTIPRAMDAPWNYNDQGDPVDQESVQRLADQRSYVAALRREEEEQEISHGLSDALNDRRRQHLATAMRLYKGGKAGFYSRLIDEFG